MTSVEIGQQAEARAEQFLRDRGFSLIQRNFRAKTGEIDLIMAQGDLLTFVEVRYRANPSYGTGAESISKAKQRKIIHTAETFLQQSSHRWNQYRFDVISIGDDIHWIPGAFTLD